MSDRKNISNVENVDFFFFKENCVRRLEKVPSEVWRMICFGNKLQPDSLFEIKKFERKVLFTVRKK